MLEVGGARLRQMQQCSTAVQHWCGGPCQWHAVPCGALGARASNPALTRSCFQLPAVLKMVRKRKQAVQRKQVGHVAASKGSRLHCAAQRTA